MKWKIIAAVVALAVVGTVLFATTVAAFMPNQGYNPNSASTGSSRNWPYWYGEGEYGYREGGMMNLWGPFSQNGTASPYFYDDWGGHR